MDWHFRICSPHKLTKKHHCWWDRCRVKRPRKTILSLSAISVLGHQRRCDWWPHWLKTWWSTPDVTQKHSFMYYIRKKMYLSTATCPGTTKETIWGSEKAMVVGEGLREEKRGKKNQTHYSVTLFPKIIFVGYRTGFWFTDRCIRGKVISSYSQ